MNVSDVTRRALRRTLIQRLIRNAGLVFTLVLAALGIGAVGYHVLDGLPWLDAALNAAMILTGMGPTFTDSGVICRRIRSTSWPYSPLK